MEISVDELLKGKSTLIKHKEYFPTRNYVEPFLNFMSKYSSEFIVKAKKADQLSITKETEDVIYNRVWVQCVMSDDYTIDNHSETYGLVYGLDARKPVAKLYKGTLNNACLNLCVFDPSWLDIQEINPGEPLNYTQLKFLLEKENDIGVMLKNMKSNFIDRSSLSDELGRWVDFCIRRHSDRGFGKIQLAASTAIKAYKQLFIDTSSEYFIPEYKDPNKFDIYNAFTEIITHDKKDILNTMEKTLLLGEMLDV